MTSDPESMRFLGRPQHELLSWFSFRVRGGGWFLDGFSRFSVSEKSNGSMGGFGRSLEGPHPVCFDCSIRLSLPR
jgi:hypothetical protein